MGMNSMGSYYNPVSFNIVNSESSEALKSSNTSSVTGMYKLFKEVKLCDKELCDFCSSIEEQTSKGSKMTKTLKTENATNNFLPIDKPSSDNSGAFYSFAKKKFASTTAASDYPSCCQMWTASLQEHIQVILFFVHL
jgi:hypothetical protein